MPARHLERNSLTASEVSDALGGLLSAHAIRRLAKRGRIPGAYKISGRVYFASNTPAWLLMDLSTTSPAGYSITIPKEGSADGLVQPPR